MKPARLGKRPDCRALEQELTITVKELLLIIFIVLVFFAFCFATVPQTFGFF